MLEQVLRLLIHSSEDIIKWETLIPTVQWVVNNTPNRHTGYSPNYLLYGYHPISPIQLLGKEHTHLEGVTAFVSRMKTTFQKARSVMEEAREKMRQQTSGKRRTQDFAIGDLVLLSTKNLKFKNYPRKLQRKFVGPFAVLDKVSPVAYKLELPTSWKIHDVFHTSLLREWKQGQWSQDLQPEALELEDTDTLYVVEKLLRWRWIGQGRHRQKEFLVVWEGYPLSEASWTPADHFSFPDVLEQMIQEDKPVEEPTTSS